MRNKRGSEKYYIIMSMILGILILAISLYFIFHEYFTSEDLDWEMCRQSIVLRSTLPEKDLLVATASAKGQFPLKCKTQVITIDKKEDHTVVEKKFADALASCWWMLGEGKFQYFALQNHVYENRCMACARLHIDPEVREHYTGKNKIYFGDALLLNYSKNLKYIDYLNNGDVKALPLKERLQTGSDVPNVFSRKNEFEVFSAGHSWAWPSLLISPVFGGVDLARSWLSNADKGGPGYLFPWWWNSTRGDVFIIVSTPPIQKDSERRMSSYLLYLQQDDFEKLDNSLAEFTPNFVRALWDWNLKGIVTPIKFKSCHKFETIPA